MQGPLPHNCSTIPFVSYSRIKKNIERVIPFVLYLLIEKSIERAIPLVSYPPIEKSLERPNTFCFIEKNIERAREMTEVDHPRRVNWLEGSLYC